MTTPHPKSIRRRILTLLYQRYQKDPLDMPNPEDFLAIEGINRENLVFNIHYLHDRQLVELMIGYSPPMFAAARITADGIDLIENQFQFDLRFPPMPNEIEEATAEIPTLIERLIEEAELTPLDGEARHCLLRDVQILRDEIARPAERWRHSVLTSVMSWIEAPFDEVGETLPTFTKIATLLKDLPH